MYLVWMKMIICLKMTKKIMTQIQKMQLKIWKI